MIKFFQRILPKWVIGELKDEHGYTSRDYKDIIWLLALRNYLHDPQECDAIYNEFKEDGTPMIRMDNWGADFLSFPASEHYTYIGKRVASKDYWPTINDTITYLKLKPGKVKTLLLSHIVNNDEYKATNGGNRRAVLLEKPVGRRKKD